MTSSNNKFPKNHSIMRYTFVYLLTIIIIGLGLYIAYIQGWLNLLLVNNNNNLHNVDKNEITENVGEDKFGIKMIYPTNTLGQTWYAKWDDGTSRTLGTNQKDPLDNSFRLGRAGAPKVTIDGKGIAIVTGKSPRMHIFGKWTNVEITLYVMYSFPDQLKSLSIHGRSNHHKDCGFGGYAVTFGGINNEGSWIRKEPVHGIYSDRIGSVDYSLPVNKWIGLKTIIRNIDGGKKVSIEGYVDDETGMINSSGSHRVNVSSGGGQWKKIVQAIDDGKWGGMGEDVQDKQRMKECTGKGDNIPPDIYKPFTKTTEAIYIRTNDAQNVKYKWFSVREIKA